MLLFTGFKTVILLALRIKLLQEEYILARALIAMGNIRGSKSARNRRYSRLLGMEHVYKCGFEGSHLIYILIYSEGLILNVSRVIPSDYECSLETVTFDSCRTLKLNTIYKKNVSTPTTINIATIRDRGKLLKY